MRRLVARAARLTRRRSLLGEILARQLAFAVIVGAIALAALWWTSSWMIQDNMRRWSEQWLANLDELGMPLYVTNDSEKYTRIESYVHRFAEISLVRYYSAAGELIFAEYPHGSDPGIEPVDPGTLAEIASRIDDGQRYILDTRLGETPIVRLGKPIWTRALQADGLLGFDPRTSAVDETLVGYVEIGLDFKNHRSQLLRTVGTAALIGVIALLLLTAALWVIDRRALLPLAELQGPLKMLARGKTNFSVAPAGHRDIVAIAHALNATVNAVNERDEKLTQLANYDPLTGLVNRHRFFELLQREIESARHGRTAALLFVDLDQFKYINDSLGHAAGDRLLMFAADRLVESVREVDTVARFGGDEFLILLPDVKKKQAVAICETIVTRMQDARFTDSGQSFNVRCSVGVTMLVNAATDAAEVLSQADLACHHAKSNGRNRFHFCNASSTEISEMTADVACSQQIQRALKEDGFILHYQPIVDIQVRETVYYEVLLRMLSDKQTLVLPSMFLPVANRFGLLPEIDRWVARRAVQSLAKLRAVRGDVRFTLNVSGSTFDSESFFDDVLGDLSANSLPVDALVIEITEQVAVRNILGAGTKITELVGRGCRFAIDDFGSGYCSYSYLKSMPVDFVKIDGSFIRNVVSDKVDQKIVKAIGEVARAAKAKTIAEHVTDYETFVLLGKLGVDFAQGYFLGKPSAKIKDVVPSMLLPRARGRARRALRAR